MKNTTLGILAILIVVFIGGYVFLGSAKSNGNTNTITGSVINNINNGDSGEVQRIVLSEKGLNYYPSEVRVKAGQPVSISLDEKVKGCLRAITIRDLGLSKYLKTTFDALDFTPTKKGAFTIACSMGMGYGKLIVE